MWLSFQHVDVGTYFYEEKWSPYALVVHCTAKLAPRIEVFQNIAQIGPEGWWGIPGPEHFAFRQPSPVHTRINYHLSVLPGYLHQPKANDASTT